jgi:hypothetical protein
MEQCITRKAKEFNFTLQEPKTPVSFQILENNGIKVTYTIIEIDEPPLISYIEGECVMMGRITNRTEFDRNYNGFKEGSIEVRNQKVRR